MTPPSTSGSLEDRLAAEFGSVYEDLRQRLPDVDGPYGRYLSRPLDKINSLAIHHSATPATVALSTIYQSHLSKGWSGIGYHFAVYPPGLVYYVGDITTSRANVESWNDFVVGICLIGDFTSTPPPPGQLNATRRLIAVLRGYLPQSVMVKGHKEYVGNATACPGATSGQWLEGVR